MSKDEQITSFLKKIMDSYTRNPDEEVDDEYIYSCLIKMNIPRNFYSIENGKQIIEGRYDLKENNYFNYWLEYYKEKNNIIGFIDPTMPNYCKLRNGSFSDWGTEQIKIYIPLDLKHILNGTTQIFDFLSRENIKHNSKVASKIRFDGIVIRVGNKEDCKKIIDFVNSQEYIKEGLIEPNPFSFSKDGITIASDGKLSFNTVISCLIKKYISFKRQNGSSESVNCEDFYHFVEETYKELFVEKKDTLNVLYKEFFNRDEKNAVLESPYMAQSYIDNFQNVFSLIINSHQPGFDFNSYLGYFDTISKGKVFNAYFESPLAGNGLDKFIYLLKNTIDNFCKYYDRESVIHILEQYINTGNPNFITRKGNLRESISTSGLREQCQYYMKNFEFNFTGLVGYMNNYLAGKVGYVNLDDKKEAINSAIFETVDKYDTYFMVKSIEGFLENKDADFYRCITRENGARDALKNLVSTEEIYNYFKNLDLTNEDKIYEYVESICLDVSRYH